MAELQAAHAIFAKAAQGQVKQALEEQRFDDQSAIRLLEWRFEEERKIRLEMEARLRVLESRR